jgi:hypothetical protein
VYSSLHNNNNNNNNNNQWNYSSDGRKPPLIRFHSLSQCILFVSSLPYWVVSPFVNKNKHPISVLSAPRETWPYGKQCGTTLIQNFLELEQRLWNGNKISTKFKYL